ncbi:MAG: GNAT family N-acetyltransferase [Parachlamydiaceae bacterium]
MKNDLHFECLMQEKNDALEVMESRNDPLSLKMSFSYTRKKTIEEFFSQYLKDYFSLADLPSVFVRYQNQRVAVLRFDPTENTDTKNAEISINIAPQWRYQGLGSPILEKALAFASQQGYEALYARVKEGNSASLKIFDRSGFKRVDRILKNNEPVIVFRYDLETQPLKRTLVIAEAGSNWKAGSFGADLERAYALIEAAKDAGADIIKFQVFKAETTYVAQAGLSDYLAFSGINENIFDVFKHLEMPQELVPLLANKCVERGIQLMASTFSPVAVAWVDPFVNMHKMGSYEISHLRLLETIAKTNKPLILSTGASSSEDIDWAVDTFYQYGGKELILLQCTAKYPASPAGMNLKAIPWLKKRYQVNVGLSDHSLGIEAPLAAVALGAKVIEKHFTLDKSFKGPDHAFALEPNELKQMIANIREIEEMLGSGLKKVDREEEELYQFARRGVQALRDIHPGERLQEGVNIAILRPGKQLRGLHPRYLEQIEGQSAIRFIAAGSGIQRTDFKEGYHG